MRKLFWLLTAMLVLQACGTKKRTVASSDKIQKKERGKTNGHPMPADTGKFVVYDINSIEEYIETFAEVAQLEMKAYGIPASITLAQGILESGFGKGELTLKTNNHFGIKCHNGWDGEYAFHDTEKESVFENITTPCIPSVITAYFSPVGLVTLHCSS